MLLFLIVIFQLFTSIFCVNDGPIIGVLSQEDDFIRPIVGKEYYSYIAASYVKFIEGAGGRVVPICIGKDENYYRNIVEYTNGILFPGGDVAFDVPGGYGEAGRLLYRFAEEKNRKGIHYPILGICLGFEFLPYAYLNGIDLRQDCDAENISLPLIFTPNYRDSRMFSQAPTNIVTSLKSENLTANFHSFCYTKKAFAAHNVTDEWKILSQNYDKNNFKFISSIEAKSYPFFGLQFHPEKNPYEFIPLRRIDHSSDAVQMSQYFADFFVNEARKNQLSYPTRADENAALIYNYNPIYIGNVFNSSFEQVYVFTKEQCGIRCE